MPRSRSQYCEHTTLTTHAVHRFKEKFGMGVNECSLCNQEEEELQAELQARITTLQTELQKDPSVVPKNKTLEEIEGTLNFFLVELEHIIEGEACKNALCRDKSGASCVKYDVKKSLWMINGIKIDTEEHWGKLGSEELRLEDGLLIEYYKQEVERLETLISSIEEKTKYAEQKLRGYRASE